MQSKEQYPDFVTPDASGSPQITLGDPENWIRKSHTRLDPKVVDLIQYYRDCVERFGGYKLDESTALNQILSVYVSTILETIEELNAIADRHRFADRKK